MASKITAKKLHLYLMQLYSHTYTKYGDWVSAKKINLT